MNMGVVITAQSVVLAQTFSSRIIIKVTLKNILLRTYLQFSEISNKIIIFFKNYYTRVVILLSISAKLTNTQLQKYVALKTINMIKRYDIDFREIFSALVVEMSTVEPCITQWIRLACFTSLLIERWIDHLLIHDLFARVITCPAGRPLRLKRSLRAIRVDG